MECIAVAQKTNVKKLVLALSRIVYFRRAVFRHNREARKSIRSLANFAGYTMLMDFLGTAKSLYPGSCVIAYISLFSDFGDAYDGLAPSRR